MCVFLVCVLVLFRASVCAFRVSELLVVRLSFVVKLFRLCSWFRSFRVEFRMWVSLSNLSSKFSCRISSSSSLNFRVEFWIRLFRFVALFDFSNFVALFDFSNLTLNSSSNSTSRISCRISNSNLSSKFVVEIFVSLLYSTSRSSSFRFEFRFEFVVEFDFSNFVALFDFSKSIVKFDFSKFDFSIQVPCISNSSFRLEFVVEFRIRLALFDFSNFDDYQVLEFVVEIVAFVSHSSFEFLIELFNFRRNLIIINALMHWRPQLFSHERSRFALVATRALRALFVRKILVKRQFTFSLYFGIIEL